MPRVSTLPLQPLLAELSERVGSDIRSGDAAFCRTALMWITLGPALQNNELIDAIGLESYTPTSIWDFLAGLVSIDPKTNLVTAHPGLHEAVASSELALGFSDCEACYVIASRCLETCTFPFLPDGTPLEHLGRSGASARGYAWHGWRFFFERAGKLDVHIEEKFDNMVKRTLHSLTSLLTLLAEQTVPCTAQTQPQMAFHARLEENGGLVLLYRALRRVLVAVRVCLRFDSYAKALPLRPDTDGHVFGPGSMRRRRKRVSFVDESFPDRAQEEQHIICAFRSLERALRIVAAIYSEEDEDHDYSEDRDSTHDDDNDCAIISDDEDDNKPPGRNERVRRWFLDAAVWARNMADVYPAASHSVYSPRGYENVIQSEYMLQRPYLQCGKDIVQISFVPWVAGVMVSAIKSPFALFSSSSASHHMPVPTSPALCEKVASSTPKTLSITPAPSTSFAAVPISIHSPLAAILPFPRGLHALRPSNTDDAWRAAKHALLRGGIIRTISYFTLAILTNHVRRMLAPWLGQYVFYNEPLSALKLAISSPQVFLDEHLSLICLRGFIAMELQKLLLDTTGAMASNVLRWAAVFDVDSPRPGRLAVDAAVLVYLLTAMANLEYMFCRTVFTAAFAIATFRLSSPGLMSAYSHGDLAAARAALLSTLRSHSPLVPVLMLLNIVTALIPLAFNAVCQALCRGRAGLLTLLVLSGWLTAHVAQFSNRYFVALELSGGLVALAYLGLAWCLILLDVLDDPLGVHIVHERLIKQIYSMGDVIFIDEVVDLRKLV
ncbi:hypothetical protein Cpir12675_006168 [Ceratocystis pirilliformis]|uniref:Uncharacterized protein n=1 Tax=Ceratocystis pirilliformis TaxID=259994 RepID=A0ABR3YKR5_9PEZI